MRMHRRHLLFVTTIASLPASHVPVYVLFTLLSMLPCLTSENERLVTLMSLGRASLLLMEMKKTGMSLNHESTETQALVDPATVQDRRSKA